MTFKPTFLYIKQHSVTGKLYFGKTTSSPEKYFGSGTYWKRHIKKYGKEYVTNLWYCLFYDEEECKQFALDFSKLANIVENKQWANAMPEDGINGWPTGENNPTHNMTPEQNYKKGSRRGKNKHNCDMINNFANNMTGENNPMFGKNYQTHGLANRAKNITGKSFDDIFGVEKSLSIRNKISASNLNKNHNLLEVKCPHCCLVGKGPNMTRYHFDKCKLKPENSKNKEIYSPLPEKYFSLLISGIKRPRQSLAVRGSNNGRYKTIKGHINGL